MWKKPFDGGPGFFIVALLTQLRNKRSNGIWQPKLCWGNKSPWTKSLVIVKGDFLKWLLILILIWQKANIVNLRLTIFCQGRFPLREWRTLFCFLLAIQNCVTFFNFFNVICHDVSF